MNCALIDGNGKVINMIVADPEKDQPPKGLTLKPILANQPVDQRWEWSDVDGALKPNPQLKAEMDAQALEPPKVVSASTITP